MNPYAELDVPRDATPEEVNEAYRRKALEGAHPDAGGNAEKFALVKLARDVLMDEKRRRHYDETGKIDETPVDNSMAHVMGMLNAALDKVITKFQGDRTMLAYNLVGELQQVLVGMKGELATAADACKAGIARHSMFLGRFKRKDGSPSLIESMIRGRVQALEEREAVLRGQIEIATQARALLDEYSFETEVQNMWSASQKALFGHMNKTLDKVPRGSRSRAVLELYLSSYDSEISVDGAEVHYPRPLTEKEHATLAKLRELRAVEAAIANRRKMANDETNERAALARLAEKYGWVPADREPRNR